MSLQNDAPVLLEEMRQQNLLNTLQLLELEADGSGNAPDAASPDTPTKLYQQMHTILDKVGLSTSSRLRSLKFPVRTCRNDWAMLAGEPQDSHGLSAALEAPRSRELSLQLVGLGQNLMREFSHASQVPASYGSL